MAGDVTEANALAVAHMGLVKQIARKIKAVMPITIDREDLEGAGYLGLIQASRRFKQLLGVSFGAYARRRIRGAMLDWLRRDDWIPRLERARFKREGIVGPTRMVSLDEKIAATSDGDRDIMRRDFLEADQKAPEHDTELADFWESPLPWVSARDWRVLQMYYRDGMTRFLRVVCLDDNQGHPLARCKLTERGRQCLR